MTWMGKLAHYYLLALLSLGLLASGPGIVRGQDDFPEDASAEVEALEDPAEGPAENDPSKDEADGEEAIPAPPSPADAAAPVVEEAPSHILLETDKTGALAPSPVFAPDDNGELRQHSISWGDIDRLLERYTDQQSARVTCQNISIEGASHGGRANLKIELTFLTSPHRWVRAPVGLSNAVITKYAAPAGGYLEYAGRDGYVVWMAPAAASPRRPVPDVEPQSAEDAEPSEAEKDDLMMPAMPSLQLVERRLTIHASVAVVESGAEKRLSLRIPRPATSSLDLLVDTPDAQASLLGGEAKFDTQPAGTGGTRITAEGVGGDVTVAWRPERAPVVASPPALEVQGLIQAYLDDGERIECSVQLDVRSADEQPFDSFTVKLPPGMRPARTATSEYEVVVVEASKGPTPETSVSTAEVRLRRPTTGPLTVRFNVASIPQPRNDSFVQIGGFEVPEAVEQWGHVLLTTGGDQAVNWVDSPNVIQVDQAPAPLRPAAHVAARFKYLTQPFSLQVQPAPKSTRMHVEPSYTIEILPDRVQLTADLKYRIDGAKAATVRVGLEGWEVGSVGGDAVVNAGGVNFDRLSPLEIPFREAVSGDVLVRVTGRIALDENRGEVRIPLPQPQADFLVSAPVTVLPDERLDVSPLMEQSRGVLAESPATVEGAPPQPPSAMHYRTRTGEPAPVLAVAYEVKTGSVSVEVESEVRVREQEIAIRQSFAYLFAYEPGKRLTLEAPREIYERGLEFLLDGAPAAPSSVEQPGGDRVQLRFPAPPTPGRRTLTVDFSQPLEEVAPQHTVAQAIPLLVPVADSADEKLHIGNHTARVLSEAGLQVALDASGWRVQSADGAANGDSENPAQGAAESSEKLIVSAEGIEKRLPLLVTRTQAEQPAGSVAVDRAWIQTWLTRTQRRDRTVFRLPEPDGRVAIRLPRGADVRSVVVVVNGVRAAPEEHFTAVGASSNGDARPEVALDLAAFDLTSEAVVELWYSFLQPRQDRWKVRLEAPLVADAGWVRECYWQLILPPGEQVFRDPPGVTPVQTWAPRGWFWERRAAFDQRDLEEWIGASHQPAPGASSQYVYSAFGAPSEIEAYTAPRSVAMLLASGVVLILGLRVIRAPAPARPRAAAQGLFVIAVLAAAAAAAFPDTAFLVAQAAVWGVVALTAAWLLGRLGGRGASRAAYSPLDSSHETASMRRPAATERRSSYATTATAPATIGSSTTERPS